MPRLRRRVISSRRISVRYVESATREQTRQHMRELLAATVEKWRAQLAEQGITLTDEMIEARRLRVGPAQPVHDELGTTLLAYRYELTALL